MAAVVSDPCGTAYSVLRGEPRMGLLAKTGTVTRSGKPSAGVGVVAFPANSPRWIIVTYVATETDSSGGTDAIPLARTLLDSAGPDLDRLSQ